MWALLQAACVLSKRNLENSSLNNFLLARRITNRCFLSIIIILPFRRFIQHTYRMNYLYVHVHCIWKPLTGDSIKFHFYFIYLFFQRNPTLKHVQTWLLLLPVTRKYVKTFKKNYKTVMAGFSDFPEKAWLIWLRTPINYNDNWQHVLFTICKFWLKCKLKLRDNRFHWIGIYWIVSCWWNTELKAVLLC